MVRRPIARTSLTILAFIATLILAALAASAIDEDTIQVDDFDQDDTELDIMLWQVMVTDDDNDVLVVNNTLEVKVPLVAGASARMDGAFTQEDFSIAVDWLPGVSRGRTLEVELTSRATGLWETNFVFTYNGFTGEWEMKYLWIGSLRTKSLGSADIDTTAWHRVFVNVTRNLVDIEVLHKDNGTLVLGSYGLELTTPKTNKKVAIGATSMIIDPLNVVYDNFLLSDLTPLKDRPIVVDPIPLQEVKEDESHSLRVSDYIHDRDGDESDLSITSGGDPNVEWVSKYVVGFKFSRGGIRKTIYLTASDTDQSTQFRVDFEVAEVNDPPHWPIVISPDNNSRYEELTSITFEVSTYDEDDGNLVVTWTSIRSGLLRQHTAGSPKSFVENDLPVGLHTITVSVTDGEHTRSTWFTLDIVELGSLGGGARGSTSDDTTAFSWCICSIMVVVVITIIGYLFYIYYKGRPTSLTQKLPKVEHFPKTGQPRTPRPSEPRMPPEWLSGPRPEIPEPPPATGPVAMPTPPPVYSSPTRTDLSDGEITADDVEDIFEDEGGGAEGLEDMMAVPEDEWKVMTEDEFVTILEGLPDGLPQPLWGIDWSALAREVISSSKMLEDGTVVAVIGGKVFRADKRDIDTFMKET